MGPIRWQSQLAVCIDARQSRPRSALNTSPKALLIMRRYLPTLLLLAFAFVSSALAQTAPPNIVVILADDLGYGDVGFNGCPDIPTPNIDSIAANGALCTNGYATHPHCSPSRAGIITGRYQHRFGYEWGPDPRIINTALGLPMTELTLPQLLRPAGYVSGAIGKWHLGVQLNHFPTERGFDEFYGFLDAASPYYHAALYRDETPVIETEYLTDAFTREGVDFINRHATQPFFLYLAYNAVHSPYDVPPDNYMQRVGYITDRARQVYAAMTVALDDGVGQVLQTLQANNILDNTLIFFLSDNGAPSDAAPSSGGVSNNYPLRGYKMNVLEGGIRVPFAVQWTGRLPANVVYDDLVSSLDIVATAAAVSGISLPTDRVYDGLNIVPYLAGDWNGFNKDDPNPPWSLTTITAPDLQGTPDAFNWFTNTIHVAATGGDTTPGTHSFTIVGAGSYSTQWGGVTININNSTDIPFFAGSALGPPNTISFEEGYYSFRILPRFKDQVGNEMKVALMKTSAPPITVSRSGQTPVNPMPHDPITVSIVTSQPKSAEERIYLRWSTDLFITSHIVEAEGSGTDYSATIPPPHPANT